jgi:magnesium transporter
LSRYYISNQKLPFQILEIETQIINIKNMKKLSIIKGLPEGLKETLEKKYKINKLDIEDVFTNTQLAKTEQKANYLYVAIHFPEFDKKKRNFISKEVHFFVTKSYLKVIDKENFRHIAKFEEIQEHILGKNPTSLHIFYEIIDFIITKIFNVIGKFKTEIEDVERAIFEHDSRMEDLLVEILIIKRNLINLISIITPMERVIKELQTEKYNKFITSTGIEMLDDTHDKIEKMLNRLNNFKEQITLLKETNETQIARNTNQTIRTLTSVNLLVLVPTIITSFFGMNVNFGWSGNPENYIPLASITTFIIILTIAGFIIFKNRKWI